MAHREDTDTALSEAITSPAAISSAVADDSQSVLKEELLRWTGTIFCTVIAYVVIALIAYLLYHPDIAALKATAKHVLVEPQCTLPEPMEALLFRLGVIVIPLGLYFFYRALPHWALFKTFMRSKTFLIVSMLPMVA